MEQKLYICGLTENKEEEILKITNTCSPYVDGFVWVEKIDSESLSNYIKEGDWCFILENSIVPNKVFLKRLKEDIFYWNKNKVEAVHGDGFWLIKYHSNIIILGNYNRKVYGIQGRLVELKKISGYRKENFVLNVSEIKP